MTKVGHTPVRRCVVCRGRWSKDELVRLAYTEGRGVVVDVGQRMPGRGVYLCGDDRCLRRGLDTKVMSSAFRKRVVIDGNVRKSIESISRRGWGRSKQIR
jgi:predicted RNA-binding protein YlxR (DUF448 family)